MYYLNWLLDPEKIHRPSPHIFADCCNPVGSLNRELRNWEVRAVCANEGDVRTVQCRDEGEPSPCSHLLREECRNRVRDRVVYVQQIEAMTLSDFGHT